VKVDCSLLISEVKLAPALVLAANYTSQEIESLSHMSAPVPNAQCQDQKRAEDWALPKSSDPVFWILMFEVSTIIIHQVNDCRINGFDASKVSSRRPDCMPLTARSLRSIASFFRGFANLP
jgi:hypothetical protein